MSPLISCDTSWMLFVLACSAFTKFLVDNIFTFSLSAALPMWIVISLAQRFSLGVRTLVCFGFKSVCNSGTARDLRVFKLFCAIVAAQFLNIGVEDFLRSIHAKDS